MWMKLGTVLVREGVITPEQLEESVRLQMLRGGRLGAILVDMNAISVDALGKWLGRVSGFPCATADMLEAATPEVLHLIPGAMAERLECMPFRRDDRSLHVAMVNPLDPAAIDALSFKTRLRIVPYVVPETLLYQFLGGRYGIVRKPVPTPAITIPPPSRPRTEAPPLRSIPPIPSQPPPARSYPSVPPPLSAPRSIAPRPPLPPMPPMPAPPGGDFSRTIPPASRAETTQRTQPPPGTRTEATQPPPRRSELTQPPAPRRSELTQPPPRSGAPRVTRPPPLTVEQATASLSAATTRDEIVDALLRYTASVFDSALLLIVRGGLAIGWQGRGEGIDESQVDVVVLPLNSDSLFQDASEKRVPAGGVVVENSVHRRFYKALRRSPPASAIVVPVMLRNRVVNLIYADRLSRLDAMDSAEALIEVARQTAAAYARILAGSTAKQEQ
jgi:hypothetical protein